jgi:SAM-dependent methyltransferase
MILGWSSRPTARTMPDVTRDLHAGFHDPRRVPAADLERFLEHADRLPGIRRVQRAQRRALSVRPGTRLLDAGCGIGLETARPAAENPETEATGLDRNRELLGIARRRADPGPENLHWLEGDLAALDLPEASFDAIRSERVLMYLLEERSPPRRWATRLAAGSTLRRWRAVAPGPRSSPPPATWSSSATPPARPDGCCASATWTRRTSISPTRATSSSTTCAGCATSSRPCAPAG